MTSDVRSARRRRFRLIVVGGIGGAVLTACAGLAVSSYAAGGIPGWALAVTLGILAAAAVPLILLGGREISSAVQDSVLAPYGVEAPAGTSVRAGVAGLLSMVLLVLVFLTAASAIPAAVGWLAVGGLVVALVALFVGNWRAGTESRRRVREVRRERGYLGGEQPWSWWAHAGYGALFAVMLPLQIWNAVRSEAWSWFFWAGSVMFAAMIVSIAWSATQKWRRERRGVTRTHQEGLT